MNQSIILLVSVQIIHEVTGSSTGKLKLSVTQTVLPIHALTKPISIVPKATGCCITGLQKSAAFHFYYMGINSSKHN